ncbi:MAG: SAM-dependent methyltransferase [Chitinophagaceae bacterium]|jgi:16S rRNA (cytidine1402-2'-O)-methyltransferase|nr:SAM-dependent methyltransferase [Chitinophagaceae bacterium]
MSTGKVYLVPSFLHEDATETIPLYVTDAVKQCHVFFTENERSARRYLKKLWKEMVIDDYQWFTIHKAEEEVRQAFTRLLQEGKNIGIISEAGCPGVADPGQLLVAAAQQLKAEIKPLVGPSSILLALMASGLNGQQFRFHGYLPIDNHERKKAIRELEAESIKDKCTQIFIETPYRNNQMLNEILQTVSDATRICVAADITSPVESIRTRTAKQWKADKPELHKKLVIFLLMG